MAIDPGIKFNFKSIKNAKPLLPKVDSMYSIDISTDSNRGNDALQDILKLKRIR
jgi:hypothetical protein